MFLLIPNSAGASVPHQKAIIKRLLRSSVCADWPESSYLGDEVLITRGVGGDDGEDVPVVFLHDVEDYRRLLLDGGPELKEHGVVILQKKKREEWRDYITIQMTPAFIWLSL